MKVLTVVGVRPEFVMATPVSRALAAAGQEEVLVHTGQHYDEALSGLFFRDLALPRPAHELNVGSAPRGRQIRAMVRRLRPVLDGERPDAVVVYGDTNSTLAGAVAAASRGVPLAHVEAGVRSFDPTMPEERNRVATDRLADLLLAPTDAAVTNLACAGVRGRIRKPGDVRRDALALVRNAQRAPDSLPTTPAGYAVATVHRAATVADPDRLRSVFRGLGAATPPTVVPLHPGTREALVEAGCYEQVADRVHVVDPVGYPAFLRLLAGASVVATDSGGIQREAMLLGTPCVTLRERTEWPETVARGCNVLAGTDADAVRAAVDSMAAASTPSFDSPAGVADRIVDALEGLGAAATANSSSTRPLPDRGRTRPRFPPIAPEGDE